MTRAALAGAFVIALAAAFIVVNRSSTALDAPASPPVDPAAQPEAQPGFLYGRVTLDGATYEGRLRWGGDQEAFWGDYFEGTRPENPWAAHMPGAKTHSPVEIFGIKIGGREGPNLRRPFMARFGHLARVEAHLKTTTVTLKSGTTFTLDRFSSGDIDDGVRVWDRTRGVVDVNAGNIGDITIEFLPTPPLAGAPTRLHGTVNTRQGDFTGYIQWNRHDCVGSDTLDGRAGDTEQHLRYDTIRSIARHPGGGARVTQLDGRELVLSGTSDTGAGTGIYVDDARYGRVLVSWDAFAHVEFSAAGSGPAYDDFPAGRPLAGRVTTRDGRHVAGRLVYDFDESETTETFDVSDDGVDYQIPFGLIASIAPGGRVVLRDGQAMEFGRTGDLASRNAGLLIFAAGSERPEHVPWASVEQIDFDGP